MPFMCRTDKKIQPGDKMQDKNPPITNRLYWLVISKFALTSEIGQATSVYSLVFLMATLSQIGLEYPLLKKSSLHRSQIFGAALTIELIIIPGFITALILLAYTDVYHASLSELLWVAVLSLALSPISFIARFALLGLSNARI